MKQNFKYSIFLLLMPILFRCEQYELPPSPYSRVETLPVVDMTETSTTFRGRVTYLGTDQLMSHGFIWGLNEDIVVSAENTIDLGPLSAGTEFEATVNSLYFDSMYYVRAFVKTSKLYVFGEVISFSSVVKNPPVIDTFSPVEATFGDTITLSGNYFHPVAAFNIVKLNGKQASVARASKTQLKVIVPETVTDAENVVNVTIFLQSSTAEGTFRMLSPQITSLSTDQGFLGQTIEIIGDNFNPSKSGNTIVLGGAVGTVVSAARKVLKVKIPERGIYDSRSFQVRVMVAGQTAQSTNIFTLTSPWLRKADVPPETTPRYRGATAFAINGAGYAGIGGGIDFANRCFRFSPEENSWVEIASYGGAPRNEGSSFVIGGKAYVGLGYSASSSSQMFSDFWSYDPQTDDWTRIADFPYTASEAVAVSANGKGYIITSNNPTGNFWEYDPTLNSWRALEDLPLNDYYESPAAGFVINDKLFVYTRESHARNNFWEYEFGTNQWVKKTSPNVYDSYHGFSINGLGYITSPWVVNRYNPTTDSWQTLNYGDYKAGDHYTMPVFSINGKAYFGISNSQIYELWEYDTDYQ